ALPDLLERAGVDTDEILTWVDELDFLLLGGPNARFKVAPYQRPFTTAAGALGNTDFLPVLEKGKLAAMSAAGMARVATDPHGFDEISVAQYAREWGVSE